METISDTKQETVTDDQEKTDACSYKKDNNQ